MASLLQLRIYCSTVKRLHETIRQTVVEACERLSLEHMAAIAREEEGDTIYALITSAKIY